MDRRMEVCKEAAILGAKKTLHFADISNKVIIEKGNPQNVVTEADLASNKVIIDLLTKEFPNDQILSEETVSDISDPLKVDRLWVIDPLDGTNSFRFGTRNSAVSIGFIEKGIPIFGTIVNIFTQDIYQGIFSKGAYCNEKQINIREVGSLKKARVVTGNNYEEEGTRKNLESFLKLDHLPWIIFSESAVNSYCDIASGRVDLVYHHGFKPWDNAVGKLLVEEAGGVFWDLFGKETSFMQSGVICGNREIAIQFLEQTTR